MIYEQNYPKPKKCSYFSFQKLNRYFFLPFFIPIICFSTKFFSETMKTNDDKKKIEEVTIDNTHTFAFIYQIIQSICLILGGLLYFISLYRSKSTNNIEINDTKSKDVFTSSNTEKKLLEKYLKRNKEVIKAKNWRKILI